MVRYLGVKVLHAIVVLWLVSVATLLLVDLVPGDAATKVAGENATPQQYQDVRESLGLDKPLAQRYVSWSKGVITGNLGRNLVPPVQDVSERLANTLPVNLELALLSISLALLVSVPLAIGCANRPGGRFDRSASVLTFGSVSIPTFLIGLLLVLIVAVNWELLPIGQWVPISEGGLWENLRYAALPTLTLAIPEIAIFTRLLRSDMIATLQEDFVLAARAKGMSNGHVLFREALRPSSFSLVTLAGLSIGRLIGGTIIVEQVFALPGVGSVLIDAAQNSDFALVQGPVLVIAVIYVAANLVVDVLYGVIDPRVRTRGALV